MNRILTYFFKQLMFLSIFYSHLPLDAATFHSILIGDTDDHELKKVIKKDLSHMQNHIAEVFQALDAVEHFNQSIYVGKRTNATILDDLKTLNVGMEDIIFLYFSGHGFNTKKSRIENWPFLYFNHGDCGINAFDIVEILTQHQPRLIICFVDCCNNILKPKEMPILMSRGSKIERLPLVNPLNIRRLFQETKGIILISAAAPGYYSEGTDEKGSCFTNSYIKFFKEKMASHEAFNWEDILSETQNKLWKRQRPYYELMLNESK